MKMSVSPKTRLKQLSSYKRFSAYILRIFSTSKKYSIKKIKKMNIFSILKVHDEYSLKQNPYDGLRLDPLSVSPNHSGVTATPLDGVSVILIQRQMF
jgi:hypothetical protein